MIIRWPPIICSKKIKAGTNRIINPLITLGVGAKDRSVL